MKITVRKALISSICLILGIILLFPLLFSEVSDPLFPYALFSASLGVLFIILGIAYWFYVWPDEFDSSKKIDGDDVVVCIDERSDSSQNMDPANIYQAGMFFGMGQGRAYFGGADLLKPNRPKDR